MTPLHDVMSALHAHDAGQHRECHFKLAMLMSDSRNRVVDGIMPRHCAHHAYAVELAHEVVRHLLQIANYSERPAQIVRPVTRAATHQSSNRYRI